MSGDRPRHPFSIIALAGSVLLLPVLSLVAIRSFRSHQFDIMDAQVGRAVATFRSRAKVVFKEQPVRLAGPTERAQAEFILGVDSNDTTERSRKWTLILNSIGERRIALDPVVELYLRQRHKILPSAPALTIVFWQGDAEERFQSSLAELLESILKERGLEYTLQIPQAGR
jgi:hypothetical protein